MSAADALGALRVRKKAGLGGGVELPVAEAIQRAKTRPHMEQNNRDMTRWIWRAALIQQVESLAGGHPVLVDARDGHI